MRTLLTTAAAVQAILFAAAPQVASADDQSQPEDLPRTNDETEIDPHVTWSQVHFEFDSAELSESGRAELMKAARWIRDNPGATVLIEGHADKVGSPPYNKDLAERRAAAVRQFLIAQGVQPGEIRILSYGEGLPLVETERPERKNRRIVLTAVQKEPIVETRTKTERVPVPVEKKVYVPRVVRVPAPTPPPRQPLGFEVLAGGGVTGFIDGGTTNFTDVGGMWTARVVGLTGSLIGFEAAYVGSMQGVDAIGLDANAAVVGNGVEGDVRLNFTRGARLQPYLFAGLGWMHYDVTNTDINTAAIDDSDDLLSIPAGAGVSLRLAQRWSLDLRGTVRGAAGDGMFHEGDDSEGMESWSGSAQAGFAF